MKGKRNNLFEKKTITKSLIILNLHSDILHQSATIFLKQENTNLLKLAKKNRTENYENNFHLIYPLQIPQKKKTAEILQTLRTATNSYTKM